MREVSTPRLFKKQLAERLRVGPSTITPYTSGEREPPLHYIEAAAAIANIPIAEFVAAPGSTVRELNADEAAILRALRQWPLSVTRALCAFVAFFADEEPVAQQTRKMHEVWRHLPPEKRAAVFGYAVQAAENMIPPDIATGLFEELSAASRAAVGTTYRKPLKRRADDEPRRTP